MADYAQLADALAEDIRAGRLRPGDRLPPQREFAFERRIAPSTASRVYSELVRRGLAVGEVGRGTYVRSRSSTAAMALAEPTPLPVDLELNFPTVPGQSELLAGSIARLVSSKTQLELALRPARARGDAGLRDISADFLARAGWQPSPDHLLFAGNGKQAIAAAIAALVPSGERLGVEALTYPFVKAVAQRLGVRLVPLDMDEGGIVPEALRAAHRATPLRAIYLQPTLHNPLGVTMPAARRAELADFLKGEEMVAIEDAVYAFLDPDTAPLHVLAPDRVILVDSLSKRLSPALSLGFIVAPPELATALASSLHGGAWTAPGLAQFLAARWMSDGSAAAIVEEKRQDARARQNLATEKLRSLDISAAPAAYHLWLRLPPKWRAETFVAAAARRNIAVTPAAAFAVTPGYAPNAIRIAMSAPPLGELGNALEQIADLVHTDDFHWMES